MDGNQSDITLTDITEAEHLGRSDVANDHENGDQVNDDDKVHMFVAAQLTHIVRNIRGEKATIENQNIITFDSISFDFVFFVAEN